MRKKENGFEKNEGTFNSAKKDKRSDGFDTAPSAGTFGMCFAVIILMGGFYVYFSKEYQKRRLKDGTHFLQDISTLLSEKKLAASGKHMSMHTDGESIDYNLKWGAKDENMIIFHAMMLLHVLCILQRMKWSWYWTG